MPKPKTSDFSAVGTQNIEKHLFREHRLVDESGKRQPATGNWLKEKTPSRNIVEMLNLDASDPKEQSIANALIQRFDKSHFQRLLLEWVVDANISFRQPEHSRLRRIFEYLNPSVAATNAHISHDTVRRRIVDLHLQQKSRIVDHLKSFPGQIHIAFDGWRSRNRHALYGIVCFYVDKNGAPSKLVLGLPELKVSHSGENIAAQILEILESYEILDRVGYITLDNAGNMDTATEQIAEALGIDPKKRRVRCFGHVLNLVVKALLFGHKAEALEAEVDGGPGVDAAQHEIWRKKGPVGKLHNLVHWIHRSDKLTYHLRALQEEFFQHSDNLKIQAKKPVDVVLDNQTRWLSTLYMIRRGLMLRPFLEDLVEKVTLEFRKGCRNGVRRREEIPLCLREESLLSEKDWKVIELMDKVLLDFEEALRMLEGDAQSRGAQRRPYRGIRLEEWKATAANYPDPEHVKININLGWDKLNEYYTKLDETPAYYAAAILNPVSRWAYFENSWTNKAQLLWLQEAKRTVRKLWDEEYKTLPILTMPDEEPPLKRLKVMSALERHRAYRTSSLSGRSSSLENSQNVDHDEYDHWLSSPDVKNDPLVTDVVQYWWGRRKDYPRLSRMALDLLSVPPMSAECERLFSVAGQMVSPLRTRLEASTIGITQTLRSWVRNGLIDAADTLIDVSGEIGESIIWQAEEDGRGAWE
ncbi:restless-like transposase [Pochonia chlamydosporia 170]|uniref:Restless-like transposase n=1 Tax=Pochonia chlamydosporia 170 TaxID=1380566 RepID=A0A179EYF3_METCM|nr:restless-like transposase [Pochonia chlamydosporia 170]OAQ57863.1 restless-like transposase [Pochonia chlamydosporia 170]